jgi:hypothetical protein
MSGGTLLDKFDFRLLIRGDVKRDVAGLSDLLWIVIGDVVDGVE